jgi:hypothetical protein
MSATASTPRRRRTSQMAASGRKNSIAGLVSTATPASSPAKSATAPPARELPASSAWSIAVSSNSATASAQVL